MTHYETLGVPVDADPARIRTAYLAAARRHHPDYHAGEDAATREAQARRMQAVNEAWEVLRDADRRERYDLSLRDGGPGTVGGGSRREPVVPAGNGWTPRSGDDGWQEDFRSWADERDELHDDEVSPGRRRLMVLPVLLFAAAVGLFALGGVLGSRSMLAAAFIALALSSGLFVLLPILEMARGRGR